MDALSSQRKESSGASKETRQLLTPLRKPINIWISICQYIYTMLPHQFFKLLSDETRLRCLLLIARHGSLRVCDLTSALEESQPKVSRHLAQLRALGVFKDKRQGQWVYYGISRDIPGWCRKVIEVLAASRCLQKEYRADNERLRSNPGSCH